MTDQELYDKIKKIIATKTRFNQAGCLVVNADTVAQLIMDEVMDMCHVVRDKAWSSGYDTCWMELKLDD